MTRREHLADLSRLTELQELSTLACREAFSAARRLTDESASDLRGEELRQRDASTHVDAVFASKLLCVDRLTLAAGALSVCDQRVDFARSAHSRAQAEEEVERKACIEADRRLEWTGDQVRAYRKRQHARREESAIREAVGLIALRKTAP